jgi:hypothetical protein
MRKIAASGKCSESTQLRERVGVVVIAIDIAQLGDQPGECLPILAAAVFGHGRTGALHELVQRPRRLGDADDQAIQLAAPRHSLKGGKNLLVSEVAAGAEEYEGV